MKILSKIFQFVIVATFSLIAVSAQVSNFNINASTKKLSIPPRPSDAISGSQFMASIEALNFEA